MNIKTNFILNVWLTSSQIVAHTLKKFAVDLLPEDLSSQRLRSLVEVLRRFFGLLLRSYNILILKKYSRKLEHIQLVSILSVWSGFGQQGSGICCTKPLSHCWFMEQCNLEQVSLKKIPWIYLYWKLDFQ